ncbi:ribonuclease H-like domain-containing protein [Tanacetum coccineum]
MVKLKDIRQGLWLKVSVKEKFFDYDETFSLVVKMVTVRCLIIIVFVNSWPLYQLDVTMHSYMVILLRMFICFCLDKSKVCKLNKSPYGLKQALRQWNAKLTTALAEHGFEQSKFDYSLYIKQKGYVFIALLVYVDDIVINVWVACCKPVDIPLPENCVLNFGESEKDKYLNDFTSYQKLVGKLINLTNTRPEVSYAVHIQHMFCPLRSYCKAALRVLRYLKGSPSYGIQFNKSSDLKLRDFADADWAKFPTKRKFVTCFCGFFRTITYVLENLRLKGLYPVELNYDNSSAIQIAAKPLFHERTKHFELDVHFVIEKVMANIIKTVKVYTNLVMVGRDKGRIQSKKKVVTSSD